MICSCTGRTNTCGCNRCRGIRLSQFAASTTISSASQFVLANDTLVSYSTLLNDIQAALVAPSFTPSIREADITGGVNVGVGTDIVICRGTGDVNLPSVALATKPVTIISTNGSAFIKTIGTDTSVITTVTIGNSYKAVPYQFTSPKQWVNG